MEKDELEFWDAHGEKPEGEPWLMGCARQDQNKIQVGGEHYTQMEIQPWDVVDTWPLEQQVGYYRGTALKYVMRIGQKESTLIQVNKAIHTLEKLRGVLEEDKK